MYTQFDRGSNSYGLHILPGLSLNLPVTCIEIMDNKKRDTQQLRDKMRWIQLFFAEERTEEEEKEMKSIEYKYGDRPMQKEDFDRMRESTKQHIAI